MTFELEPDRSASCSRVQARLMAWAIFLITLTIFLASHIDQIGDSRYTILLGHSLMTRGSAALESYEPEGGWLASGKLPYQLEKIRGHTLYFFPHGGALLSIPAAAIMQLIGKPVVNDHGKYDSAREARAERILPAFLMAGLGVIFFYTALLLLPVHWSGALALVFSLGTPVWSTASRSVWSDTWGIFLAGILLLWLLAVEIRQARIRPVLFGTLLSFLFFVRPNYSLHIIFISAYLFLFHRRHLLPIIATGLIWLAGFLIYSHHWYGTWLPTYYATGRMGSKIFWMALATNLFSPSRGFLIYVPMTPVVIWLCLRYWALLPVKRLVWMTAAAMAGQIVACSSFADWNAGGHCYGSRYLAGIVAWVFLLAVLGVNGWLKFRKEQGGKNRLLLATGITLAALGIAINSRGAMSHATSEWNVKPENVDLHFERIWDWRYPQFMAGLMQPPLPSIFPVMPNRIDFGNEKQDSPFLAYGWGLPQTTMRYSDKPHAAVIFFMDPIRPVDLEIKLRPFLVPGKINEQILSLSLNGHPLQTLHLNTGEMSVLPLHIPREILQNKNVLMFDLPGAENHNLFAHWADYHKFGVSVESIAFIPPAGSP